MAKSAWTFGFTDEPMYRVPESRAYLANALRAYRRHPERYSLARVAGGYIVKVRGSKAVALIRKVPAI